MKTDKIIRIRLTTLRKLRAIFPSYRGETMNNYFDRLSKWLEEPAFRQHLKEEGVLK